MNKEKPRLNHQRPAWRRRSGKANLKSSCYSGSDLCRQSRLQAGWKLRSCCADHDSIIRNCAKVTLEGTVDLLATAEPKMASTVQIYLKNSLKKHLIIFPCLAFSTLPQVRNSLDDFHGGFELTAAVSGPYVSHFRRLGFFSLF